jgi:preprotein translocase subunit SecA
LRAIISTFSKHLLDYDDVLNKHREAVYRRRDAILLRRRPGSRWFLPMVDREIERIVQAQTAGEDRKSWSGEGDRGKYFDDLPAAVGCRGKTRRRALSRAAATAWPMPRSEPR